MANEAAADFCVPRRKMEKFVSVKYSTFAERDILGVAKTLNIHPSLGGRSARLGVAQDVGAERSRISN